MTLKPDAEAKKEEGNRAFASKNYQTAIDCYTEAIRLDPTNHVYYSNRSVSYASLALWSEAADDARECLRLDPTFVKGFYRLATAQIESGSYDDAMATIRSGLRVDPDNSQLTRLMRLVRAKKGASEKAAAAGGGPDAPSSSVASAGNFASASSASAASAAASSVLDPTLRKELADLQEQFANCRREYQKVKLELAQRQTERRRCEVTAKELDALPDGGRGCKMYLPVGKMFLATPRDGVIEYLTKEIEEDGRRGKELEGKAEFLEKRMRSQQQNIQELIRSH